MPRKIRSIRDVAENQLCLGCGACASVQPDEIQMVDDVRAGRRPLVLHDEAGREADTSRGLAICPGVGYRHDVDPDGSISALRNTWGPVLELWEGYATHEEARFGGSSGGAATAIALHCLEEEGVAGVLHTAARRDVPYLNETVLSSRAEELLAATGSKYAPASPCDGLDKIVAADGPCVFIGKPCDVAAVSAVRRNDPALDRNLAVTVAIFCAGTPTTNGTFEMLRAMGIENPDDIVSIRYRGNGWPGEAEAVVRTPEGTDRRTLTYDESWGEVLQKHRQWRCYVCADHTGELADIAVGDPWYRDIIPGEPGRSLIVVRTERGRQILHAALRSGAIDARVVAADRLPASQPGLLKVRGAVFGRILASRLLGIPAPRFPSFPMFHVWLHDLSFRDKLRSTLGLLRRAPRKGLFRRHPVVPMEHSSPERPAA